MKFFQFFLEPLFPKNVTRLSESDEDRTVRDGTNVDARR